MGTMSTPTTELGTPGGILPATGPGATGWVLDTLEQTPELRHPAAALIYDRMRKEDGLIGASLRAMTSPILAATWHLDGEDVPDDVLEFVTAQLGMTSGAAGRRRRRRRGIVLTEHLREALLMLAHGFMAFEQVYDVAPGDGLNGTQAGRLYAYLRKLGPRSPRTLREVKVGRDGGLEALVQESPDPIYREGVTIPVDRLVWYVNDREGAEWTGTSVLRSAYKHWLFKDAFIRLDAQSAERNGMGVPLVTYEDPSQRAESLKVAAAFKAGATAGAAVPKGTTVTLLGVQGKTYDILKSVEYHDRKAAQATLTQFLELGHDGGIGQGNVATVFADLFVGSLNAVARNIADTITEHVIRDLVEINYGPDTPYPILNVDDLTSEDQPTADALAKLTERGLITTDRPLEDWVRGRYGLPAKPDDAPAIPANAVPAAIDNAPQLVAASADTTLVDRVTNLVAQVAALQGVEQP